MKSESPNRLIYEKSPYLLQHSRNPVWWYPWGAEAFEKAKKENKPVFLSIGYSTCHWCHVMEKESFEDAETAGILNAHFVSVKVDREERPDIDTLYMSFVTSTTGSGGWPMSVFLTPQQKPFYGGTYFPPQPRWGSPGFKDLLLSVHENWKRQEQKIRESGEAIIGAMMKNALTQFTPGDLKREVMDAAFEQISAGFDDKNGGFGHAPKFPMGHVLSFLLRYGKNADRPRACEMAERTLTAMASGGICDQLGGGFHRYSTDSRWQVPHFEKMLYDQALLARAYLDAYTATGKTFYAQTARRILDYVFADLRDREGGFYCAEDADSVDENGEKKEGAFYLWDESEIKNLLTEDEARAAGFYFGIAKNGNAEFDPHGEFTGKNILGLAHSLEQTAGYLKIPVEKAAEIFDRAKTKMLKSRNSRPRPHRDDKILTDWNGLMISAFALAGRIFNEPAYLKAAAESADFIIKNLMNPDGRLLHRYRDKESGIDAGIDDYSFFINALLDLFENTFDSEYLEHARRLAGDMLDLFWDQENSGFFMTPSGGEQLIYRPKEITDGAVPSGNSMAILILLRLFHLTGEEIYSEKSESSLKAFIGQVRSHPFSHAQMLMALQYYFGPVKKITVSGATESGHGPLLIREIFRAFIPQRVIVIHPDTADCSVTICENNTCRGPIKDPQVLRQELLK